MTRHLHIFHGFHLIEILITLAIIAILSAIAVPEYSQYIVHERRLEASATLSKLALALEEYHFKHNSYESATLKNLTFPEMIAGDNYQLIITSVTLDEYVITATPIHHQAIADSACGSLSLYSNGDKRISGTKTVNACW